MDASETGLSLNTQVDFSSVDKSSCMAAIALATCDLLGFNLCGKGPGVLLGQ